MTRCGLQLGLASRFARRRRIDLLELAEESWILSRNEVLPGTPLADAFDSIGLPLPARRVVSGSLNMRFYLLETGRFITLLPHSLLSFARLEKRVKVLPISSRSGIRPP